MIRHTFSPPITARGFFQVSDILRARALRPGTCRTNAATLRGTFYRSRYFIEPNRLIRFYVRDSPFSPSSRNGTDSRNSVKSFGIFFGPLRKKPGNFFRPRRLFSLRTFFSAFALSTKRGEERAALHTTPQTHGRTTPPLRSRGMTSTDAFRPSPNGNDSEISRPSPAKRNRVAAVFSRSLIFFRNSGNVQAEEAVRPSSSISERTPATPETGVSSFRDDRFPLMECDAWASFMEVGYDGVFPADDADVEECEEDDMPFSDGEEKAAPKKPTLVRGTSFFPPVMSKRRNRRRPERGTIRR